MQKVLWLLTEHNGIRTINSWSAGLTRRHRQPDILGCPERRGDVTVPESAESWRCAIMLMKRAVSVFPLCSCMTESTIYFLKGAAQTERKVADRILLKKQVKRTLGRYCSTWQELSGPQSSCRSCSKSSCAFRHKVVFGWRFVCN